MRAVLLLTLLLATDPGLGAKEVYRWVDRDGVVHYSDRPREGAERIELKDAQTFSAPTVRPRSRPEDGEPEDTFRYERLEIVSPAQEEVLWNIEGQLDVSMQLQPRLQRGHRIELFLDGQPVDNDPRSLTANVTEVFRGVHVLTAKVTDPSGNVLAESQPRTFAVQQTSVLNPNNPNFNPPPGPR